MDMFSKELRGLPFREKSRVLKIARSGRRVEDPDVARRIEPALREQFSFRRSRSWWWQLVAFLVILVVLIWVRFAYDARWLAGGIGGGLVFVIVAVWIRSREKATARANGWVM